ncbi:branched-chain amino acid ABC transporter permease [Modestobacter sp. I12A-02628]|uniref:Branched-chain amino acid ABC transporter permease n=1 Tax=Goekera deserti TaxID=2497753 RepID=A0A7K3WCX6_9ACTN|nr:branched-chain amino acid ABC transporter permease [Goekera deserti]MPQ99217.1 branched-chain amino acid ABC transporter permease [Goekera deserti]NDI47552.1 branched-chain amino acid ABC transporter permease [Goekera deserti]NEL53363.1 branched-chain amino acid ABC transporter permease [Goekera deserti]
MTEFLDALQLGVRAMFAYQAVFFALLAIGLNLHFGYTGLLNFGQIAFAMLGGYGIAISVSQWGLPFGVGVLVGLGAAVVLALLLGLPTLRLRADYLGIVTIAAAEALRLLFRSVSATDLTGSTLGLQAFNGGFLALCPWTVAKRYDILGTRWSGAELWVITVGWTLVLLCSLLVFALMRSPWGRVLRAVREDEDAARALGKNVYAYKMQSLVLGGVFGALGGMVYAVGTGAVQPDQYQNANTFLAYGALILGGAARVLGPVIGAMLLWFIIAFSESGLTALVDSGVSFFGLFRLDEVFSTTDVSYARFVIIGLGIMLLMVFRPQGIIGDRREVMLDAR